MKYLRSIAMSAAAALLLPQSAAAAWHTAVSDHFIIYSEGNPKEVEEFASRLEHFDKAVRLARDMEDVLPGPAGKVTVFAVRDVHQLQKLASRGPSNILGFYIPRFSGSVAYVPRSASGYSLTPEVIFFHEYAHHLMLQSSNDVLPPWLVEGFAEFYSTAQFEADGSVGFGRSAAHRKLSFLYSEPIALEKLLSGVDKKDEQENDQLYARGWLLTHYLAFNKERQGQLTKYINSFKIGLDPLDAARGAFGNLGKLNNDLDSYHRQARLPYATVTADRIKVGKIQINRLTPAQEALMPVLMMSKRGVSKEKAQKLVVEVRELAQRFPGDASILTALAEAEYDAEQYSAALVAAQGAASANPRHIDAVIYKGMAQLKLAKDEAGFREARATFAAANRIDPDDPEPLVLFYDSYEQQKMKPTDNAATGMIYAATLVPQDSGLRARLVSHLINKNKPNEAVLAIAPLAYAAHNPKLRDKMQEVMTALRAGDTSKARSLMDAAKAADEAEEGKKD